jgi:hypothetical protein
MSQRKNVFLGTEENNFDFLSFVFHRNRHHFQIQHLLHMRPKLDRFSSAEISSKFPERSSLANQNTLYLLIRC